MGNGRTRRGGRPKTEVKAFCPLSRKQAALYQQAVEDLARQLETVDGIKRRGMVLAFLMRTSMGVACSV
jgi:SNF2 family DNA or RNA helicase